MITQKNIRVWIACLCFGLLVANLQADAGEVSLAADDEQDGIVVFVIDDRDPDDQSIRITSLRNFINLNGNLFNFTGALYNVSGDIHNSQGSVYLNSNTGVPLTVTSVSGNNAILTTSGTLTAPAVAIGNATLGFMASGTNQLAVVQSGTARLIVDNTGSVSTYSQYKMHAFANTNQTASSSTANSTVTFGTTTFDPNNNFSGGNTYTAPISGYYWVSFSIAIATASEVVPTSKILTIFKNGIALNGYSASLTPVAATTGPYHLNGHMLVQLTAGDQLTIVYSHTTLIGNETIQGSATTSPTHLGIHFMSTV